MRGLSCCILCAPFQFAQINVVLKIVNRNFSKMSSTVQNRIEQTTDWLQLAAGTKAAMDHKILEIVEKFTLCEYEAANLTMQAKHMIEFSSTEFNMTPNTTGINQISVDGKIKKLLD